MIRRARWFDMLWIWRLRNSPDVRAYSRLVERIPFWVHVRWWVSKRRGRIWVAQGWRRQGYVRLSDGEVSVAVAAHARRRGVSVRLLTIPQLRGRVTAVIHHDNEVSRRAFWRAGFFASKAVGPWYIYER